MSPVWVKSSLSDALASPKSVTQTVPARGQLFYSARLDGTGVDLVEPMVEGVITQTVGAIELRGSPSDQTSPGGLNLDPRPSYVVEYAFAADAGSTVEVRSELLGDYVAQAEYFLRVSTRNRAIDLVYFTKATGRDIDESLTPRIPVPALLSGEPFWVAVVVEQGRMTLFLDQQQVAQVSDSRITTPFSPLIRTWGDSSATGAVRVLAARVYALP
jgi:hypothetical protein